MRPIRRLQLAMIGGARFTQPLWGGSSGEENVVKPTQVKTEHAFNRGKDLIAASQATKEENGSVCSKANYHMATSMMTGVPQIVAKQPVTQHDFVDALTAVMTGKVEFSDDGKDDDDDDVFSISTVSTTSSHAEASTPTPSSPTQGEAVGIGQMFFYLDQKNPLRHLVTPLESELDSSRSLGSASRGQSKHSSSPAKKENDYENEMHFGHSVASIQSMIEAKAKDADRDGLFEKGCEMHREGERLLSEGKIDEARDALLRARSFQKRSLQLITSRMAAAMHKQGLDHCDRGDKYLAVILLGVAEIIKHRPSAANIHMGAQVHRGYRRVCPKDQKSIAARREVDGYMKTIEREAIPMAKTLQTYSKSLTMHWA